MCIQKHPCKYKCYQNYTALFNEFLGSQNSSYNYGNNCWCKKTTPKQNCSCFRNLFPMQSQQNELYNKNKYSFRLQGTIKFNGFC